MVEDLSTDLSSGGMVQYYFGLWMVLSMRIIELEGSYIVVVRDHEGSFLMDCSLIDCLICLWSRTCGGTSRKIG